MKNIYFAVLLVYLAGSTLPLSAGGPAWPENRLRGANIATSIKQGDIDHYVNDWGGNSVRILFNNLVPPPPSKPDAVKVAAVYRTIDMCLDAGLFTVLSFSPSFEDNDAFFNNETYMDAYVNFWRDLAGHYANDKRGVAWDLMNEPHGNLANTKWLPYAKRLVSEIREIDTLHTIVIEPPGWGWPYGFEYMQPIDDDNLVYSFHFYGPMDYTHQRNNGMLGATEQQWLDLPYPGNIEGEYWNKATIRRKIQPAFDWAKKYDVKMWCGEFGCTRWAIGASDWIHDIVSILEEEKIGWSWYAYREWYPMDIEMNPDARMEKTERSETELVKYFKQLFSEQDITGSIDISGGDVTIYPNPAKDYLTIESANPQKTMGTLYSSMGQTVLNFGFEGNKYLSTGNIEPGLYFLHLTRDNLVCNSKIVIVK